MQLKIIQGEQSKGKSARHQRATDELQNLINFNQRSAPYETGTVAFEKQLQCTRLTKK